MIYIFNDDSVTSETLTSILTADLISKGNEIFSSSLNVVAFTPFDWKEITSQSTAKQEPIQKSCSL